MRTAGRYKNSLTRAAPPLYWRDAAPRISGRSLALWLHGLTVGRLSIQIPSHRHSPERGQPGFVESMAIATALAKSVLPPPVRLSLRNLWEKLRDWLDVVAFAARFMAACAPLPKTLLYFGYAPGDDLLCTAIMRELRLRGHDRILMISDHRDLFIDNKDFTYLRPSWKRYDRYGSTVSICERFVRIWGGMFVRPEYAPPCGAADRRTQPSQHIVAEMCARTGITGPVSVRPYLALTETEKKFAPWARNCIAIQSSGMIAHHPMRNKQWREERFQGVVDTLYGEFEFIQIGSLGDPPLRHVRDLRGATGIRQTAAILYEARLYVGTVGFLMHLARAVECPSVIVFGGREAPWQTGYICNSNLCSTPPCSPCWRDNTCDLGHKCMEDIGVADVVAAVRKMMRRPRNPLAVETVKIK
jgi:hypothetical protein